MLWVGMGGHRSLLMVMVWVYMGTNLKEILSSSMYNHKNQNCSKHVYNGFLCYPIITCVINDILRVYPLGMCQTLRVCKYKLYTQPITT